MMILPSGLIGMRRKWLLPLGTAITLEIAGLAPSALRAQSRCPSPVPVIIVSPNLSAPAATMVPDDVCIPPQVPQVPSENLIKYFDDYSWRTFVALVWPALIGQRGTPDPAQNLSKVDVPLVFETFKADWETFQPNGTSPTSWNDTSAAYMPCPNAKPGEFILSSFTKFGNVGRLALAT